MIGDYRIMSMTPYNGFLMFLDEKGSVFQGYYSDESGWKFTQVVGRG